MEVAPAITYKVSLSPKPALPQEKDVSDLFVKGVIQWLKAPFGNYFKIGWEKRICDLFCSTRVLNTTSGQMSFAKHNYF